MRTITILILTLFSLNFAVGQNLKKAFKYLSDKDFDRAKVIFDEVSKQPELCSYSCYGSSLIYMNDQYRAKDLYRAYEAITKAVNSLDKADLNELKKLSEFIPSKETILKQKEQIDLLLYQQVKEENSIQASERFIKEAIGSTYLNAVKAIYATQRYNQAMEFNTIMAYEDFIKEFPESKEFQSAWQKIYSLAYKEVVKKDKLADYQAFVEEYPNSPQVEGAKKKIIEKEYEMVLLTGTDDAFDRFIQKYPTTQQSKDLRQKQLQMNYVQARQLNTVNVYNNFLKKFSDSQYVNEIKIIRDSLAYLEAKSINTPQAFKDFINKYPNAAQVSRVLSLQKDLSFSKVEIAAMKTREKFASRSISKMEFYKVDKTDSTKKVLVKALSFDATGNTINYWEKTVAGAEVIIERKYSENGQRLITESKKVDGNPRYSITNYYSENDLIDSARKICYQPCEDGLPAGNYSIKYEYYPDRNIKEMLTTSNTYSKKSTYIINNQGLISQEIIIIKESEETTEFKINFQYDFYDRLIQKSTFSDENTISAVETFFYNNTGEITKYSAYDALGKVKKSNEYGANGLLMSTEIEYPNEPKNDHTLVCSYSYF